jgi:H2-forming N5,N10-methylenetetrahydromethanopterin dehydrogenase-like enzyme
MILQSMNSMFLDCGVVGGFVYAFSCCFLESNHSSMQLLEHMEEMKDNTRNTTTLMMEEEEEVRCTQVLFFDSLTRL